MWLKNVARRGPAFTALCLLPLIFGGCASTPRAPGSTAAAERRMQEQLEHHRRMHEMAMEIHRAHHDAAMDAHEAAMHAASPPAPAASQP